MKLILLVLLVLIVISVAAWAVHFYMTVQVSKKLIHNAVSFQLRSEDHTKTFLILGDSTAVGVGATHPEESLAGRLSTYADMTYVENNAKSGALTADLPGQIAQAQLTHYDLILIQIGGNDIIQFHDPKKSGIQLEAALRQLPQAEQVIIISAGDVGGATLFPPPVRWIHTYLNNEHHREFIAAVARAGIGEYINFGILPTTKTISASPKIYLAADGLHPSSEGYELWFEDVSKQLKK
ncbi:MAG: putative secreted protein [Parcubacteria bacterium C7867-008]|nr:MAG: putative secreted protein [Parcubacteria bacterium C7867-008]